jgi:hypothetical protein
VLPPATPELSARAEPSRSPALAPSSPTPMNPDSTAPAASPSASPTPRAAAEVHAAGHRALLGLAGGLALLQLGALLVGRRRTVDGRRRGVGGPA